MNFNLVFSPKVREEMQALKEDESMEHHYKEVNKALNFLSHDTKHPSLHTHKYHHLEGKNGEEVFEAYAENHSPGAYRIFWHYGPGRGVITILDIVSHP